MDKLKELMPGAVTWSNGNIFRSLTLLAVTWCELFNLPDFDPDAALTPSNLAGFMKMMKFDKFDGKWDIQVKGLGLDFLVSQVSNTLLKEPKVGKHIPTVAERTQGEVVGFAASATQRMGDDGMVVLLEGRQQTVDYVPTRCRYTLVMSDTTLLGQRRAAQRLAAAVWKEAPKPADAVVSADGATTTTPAVAEPTSALLREILGSKLDEMAFEAGVAVSLEPQLVITLAVGSPMGLTVREIEPDNFLLVTGVEPGSQASAKGARIGYFVRSLAGKEVTSLDDVFAGLSTCKEQGLESFELLLSSTPPSLHSELLGSPSQARVRKGDSLSRNGGNGAAAPVPLVICGPSGVGKGTLIGKLLQSFPGTFGFSVSHTTRAPRPGETNGVDYHFTTVAEMEAAISRGEFLEHANVHGNFYGTSFAAVKDVSAKGKVCILDIDVQGCKSVKAVGGGTPELPELPHFVFVAPPNMEALQKRLTSRGTETPAKIATRVANAVGEVSYGLAEGNFDAVVVNDDLEVAYGDLVQALANFYPAVAEQVRADEEDGEYEDDDDEEEEEESPAEFLVRVGLGQYVSAFLKFGVETVSDIETSARLLSDEELGAELGMAPKDVALFREIFAFESGDEEGDELEEDDSDGSL